MAGKLFKIAGLVAVVAALTAPAATAMRIAGDEGGSTSTQPATYLNTPALDQGMQGPFAAPNDRAGTQGVGQTSVDTIGMGGQYGQNLIQNAQSSHKRDVQAAKTFTLPLAPDDRQGTTSALVIPYLSNWSSLYPAQFSGAAAQPAIAGQPYLGDWFASLYPNGIGAATVRPDDRAGSRPSVPTSVATPVATGDGFNWGTAGIGAAGLAALALAFGLAIAMTRKNHKTTVAAS